jgi:hypothetical protein
MAAQNKISTDTPLKNVCHFSVPSLDVTDQLSLDGNNLIFPLRESLVSDIPAGDGKIVKFFYSVCLFNDLEG